MDIRCNKCEHEYHADSMGYCPKCGSSDQKFINLPETVPHDEYLASLEEENKQLRIDLDAQSKTLAEVQEHYKSLCDGYDAQSKAYAELEEKLNVATKQSDELKKKLDAAQKKADKK